jgi:arylsulfatase A
MDVRNGAWKLHIKGSKTGQVNVTDLEQQLLYNLEIDPSEQYDVFKENPEVVKNLKAIIEKHLTTVEKKHFIFDDVNLGNI